MRVQVELETTQGLEEICVTELSQVLGYSDATVARPGTISLNIDDADLSVLSQLQTAAAAFVVIPFDIPRPKALLGHENMSRLVNTIVAVRQPGDYRTLHINAAGSHTSVMKRIQLALANALRLELDPHSGDLLIRIRKLNDTWHILVRITARPYSLRSWRRCNLPGALNGPAAAAISHLLGVQDGQTVINLMCGSGSFLAERYLHAKRYRVTQRLVGCDIDINHLVCATNNLDSWSSAPIARLIQGDVSAVPLPSHCADLVFADMPFGHHMGSHRHNLSLYPDVLREGSRILKPGGLAALLTHEVKLMEKLLAGSMRLHSVATYRLNLRGIHPRLFLLQRSQSDLI